MRMRIARSLAAFSDRWMIALGALVLTGLLVGSASAGPVDISGLALWLDADAGNVTRDGSNRVSAWNDITDPTNNTVAQNVTQTNSAKQPLWVDNAIGGHPAIQFAPEGSGTVLFEHLNNTTDSLLSSGSARTIIMVGDADDSSNGGDFFTFRRSTTIFAADLLYYNSSLGFISYSDGLHSGGNAWTVEPEASAARATIRNPFISVHASAGAPAKIEVDLNGNPLTINQTVGVYAEAGTAGFTVGTREGAYTDGGWPGKIAELLVYDRKLSGSELNTIGVYLEGKYGLDTAYSPVKLFTGTWGGTYELHEFNGELGGPPLDSFAAPTSGGYQDVEIGPDGNLYAAQMGTAKIVRFDPNTHAGLPGFGQTGADYSAGSPLSSPIGVTFGPDGHLFVTNSGGSVNEFQGPSDPQPGQFVANFLSGLGTIDDIEFLQGDFYIAKRANQVLRYTAAGLPNPAPGHTGATFADATDGLGSLTTRLAEGPDGFLYVGDGTDTYRFDTTTGVGSVFISGFYGGMAFGPHDGNLYITDYSGNRIRKYDGITGLLIDLNFATGIDANPTFLTFYVIPEPSTLVLLALGGLSLLACRRRKK